MAEQIMKSGCKYGTYKCLCGYCQDQCNNGFECAACAETKKHENGGTYICTGFTHSNKRKVYEITVSGGAKIES